MTNKQFEVPEEFADVIKILEFGASKYAPNAWLEPNAPTMDHKSNHASIFRHVAESYAGKTADAESGIDPLLHAACRCLMAYTRKQRGIVYNAETNNE